MSYQIILFLIAIFLIRFPPIYYLGINNVFFTTHIISVIIFIFLFILTIWQVFINEKKVTNFNIENILILLFLLSQSFSIINAQNILVFLQRYLKILIGVTLFIFIRFHRNDFLKNYKLIIKTLLLGFAIALIFQWFLILASNLYFYLGGFFIYKNVLAITKAHYESLGKLFDDTYLELATPFLIYFFYKSKKNFWRSLFFLIIIFILGALTFASNFRYRLISFIFSLIFTLYIFIKAKSKIIISIFSTVILFLGIFITFNLMSSLSNNYLGGSILDRFTIEEGSEGFNTIKSRLQIFLTSIDQAKSNFFGVGLGNFYDTINNSNKLIKYSVDSTKIVSLAALEGGPHNIFFQILAETGFAGLLSFISLIIFFIYKDLNSIKKKVIKEKLILIASFWTLIIIAQFIPTVNLTFYSLFFIFRALI